MEQTKAIQTFQKNSEGLPVIKDARSLAAMRMNTVQYPHYSTVARSFRIDWLNLEIMKYMRLSHMKPTDTTIDAVALDEMIMEDKIMADLIQPEMDYAFRQGVFGKYGDFYGITAMSLYGFLESYLSDEKKVDAAKIIQAENERRLAERKRREQEEEQKRIREEIEEAKRNGTFTPTRGYDGLKLQTVDKSLERLKHRHEVLQQARKIYSGEIKI